jgi:hypothetical protein
MMFMRIENTYKLVINFKMMIMNHIEKYYIQKSSKASMKELVIKICYRIDTIHVIQLTCVNLVVRISDTMFNGLLHNMSNIIIYIA